MQSRLSRAFLVMTFLWVAVDAFGLSLSGMVADAKSDRGIAGLTVKLTPPTSPGRSQVVSVTDQDGAFVFRELAAGRFLFQVSQGTTVVYREVLTLDRDTEKRVLLRRR